MNWSRRSSRAPEQLGAVTVSTNMAGRGTDIPLASENSLRALGGLCVIGTNRHESRRIDHQLRGPRGKAGRSRVRRDFISAWKTI